MKSKSKLHYKYEGQFSEDVLGKEPQGSPGELLIYFEHDLEEVILIHYKGNFRTGHFDGFGSLTTDSALYTGHFEQS